MLRTVAVRRFIPLILALATPCLSGCADVREANPFLDDPTIKDDIPYAYPHDKTWLSAHAGFVSKNGEKIIGTSKDCTVCHAPGTPSKRWTMPAAKPRNVSCAITCHAPQNGAPSDSSPSTPIIENNSCLACHAGHANRPGSHFPAAAGLCTTCHISDPTHAQSPQAHPMKTRPSDVSCYSCHFRMDRHSFVHSAMTQGPTCSGCHDAHGSGNRFLLKSKTVQGLCIQCHKEKFGTSQHASVHGALNSEASCLSCHDPHSSEHGKVLNQPSQALCVSCHVQMKAKIETSPFVHSPVLADGKDNKGCITCHDSHATEEVKLLKDRYPVEHQAEYKPATATTPNTYALCMKCHSPSMLNKTVTFDKSGAARETKFRDDRLVNGKIVSKNLHWYHVVDAAGSSHKTSGKTCFTCHDPHAANQNHNIRDVWYMGAAQFPINVEYTATPKGGTCTKSCHEPKSYQRVEK